MISSVNREVARASSRIVLGHHGMKHEFSNDKVPVVIGRGREYRISILSRKASRQPVHMEWRSGQFHLIDLSSNGTAVNFGGPDATTIRREELVLFGSGSNFCGGGREEMAEDAVSFRVVD